MCKITNICIIFDIIVFDDLYDNLNTFITADFLKNFKANSSGLA